MRCDGGPINGDEDCFNQLCYYKVTIRRPTRGFYGSWDITLDEDLVQEKNDDHGPFIVCYP